MKKIGLTVTMIALTGGVFAQQQTYNHRAMQAQNQEEEAQEHEEGMQQAQDKSVSQAYKSLSSPKQPNSPTQPVTPSDPDEEEIIIEEDNYGYDEDDLEDNMSPEDDDEDGPQTE